MDCTNKDIIINISEADKMIADRSAKENILPETNDLNIDEANLLIKQKCNEGLENTIALLWDSYTGTWQTIGTLSAIFLAAQTLIVSNPKIPALISMICSLSICFGAVLSTGLILFCFSERSRFHQRDVCRYINIKDSSSPVDAYINEQNKAAKENKRKKKNIDNMTYVAYCCLAIQAIAIATCAIIPVCINITK